MNTTSRYVVAFIACYAAGFIGSLFIGPDVGTWYEQLAKPPLTPPVFVFVFAWLILYGLMGMALGLLWTKTTLWHPWVGFFFVSLLFNASWTMFFFGFHAILLAFIDASVLMMMLVPLLMGAWEIERRAFYLTLPYAAWVGFALYLSASIWLNG